MINHIRGDTFNWGINITGATGITGVRAQIRTKTDELVADTVITGTGTAYTLTVDDTTDWPIAKLFMDIQVTMGDVIKSSTPITINVTKDVTRNV